jgi:ribosomal protein L28
MSAPTGGWAAPRGRMHRAFKGLYANRMIQFGNKVSFAENKSRRTWKPNVQVKSMYSETLGLKLRFRVTTHAMRCIRKAGGIDGYLLKAKDSEIKYPVALEYKRQILAARKARAENLGDSNPSSVVSCAPGPLNSSKPTMLQRPSLSNALLDGPSATLRCQSCRYRVLI